LVDLDDLSQHVQGLQLPITDAAFLSNRAGLGENLGTMPLDALERRELPR
jgi:hypothetical protein